MNQVVADIGAFGMIVKFSPPPTKHYRHLYSNSDFDQSVKRVPVL